jgi:hypothetical protein
MLAPDELSPIGEKLHTQTPFIVQDQVGAMRWLNENLKNLRQEILTRDFFDGGYVQQYVVHGTLVKGGGAFRMPLCMRVIVRDGRVAQLNEYLDSAHLKPLQ